jgi:hypothetical protein
LVAGKTNLTTAFSNLETAVSNQEKKETYMSKNLTRKGLALSAVVALGASFFAGTPAFAAGLATGAVSLTPSTGTEYSVLAGQSFSLKANSASAVTGSGKNLKFLVADSASAATVTAASSNVYNVGFTAATATIAGLVSVTSTAASQLKTGDHVAITGVTASAGNTADFAQLNVTDAVVTVTDSTHFTYSTVAALAAGTAITGVTAVSGNAKYLAASRAVTGNFVYDSHTELNTSNRTLVLTATTTASVSVDVTAWVDDNGDNKIDDTEYVSPTRTVKFLKAADIVPTVTLAPVTAGATDLTAYITTAPALNGQQVGDKIGAVFTRQDSTTSAAVLGASAYNDDTKTWTITKSLSTTDTTGNAYNTRATGTDGTWLGLNRAIAGSSASTVIAATVATTTKASHGLRVGDKVTFTSNTDKATLGAGAATGDTVTVLSVPTVDTFTWTSTVTTLTATTAAYTVATYTGANSIVDRAFPGTYTATAALFLAADIAQTTAAYLTKFGTAATNASVSKTAAKVAVDVVASATVGRTATGTADVLKATNTASVVATVTNKDKGTVGAGVQVSATVSNNNSAGTVTVNDSLQSTVYAVTDANGQATFTVKNTSGVAGEHVTLTIASEGVSGDNTEVLTWSAAKYSIVDLNDASSIASGVRARTAVASYTFNLLVEDQFKNAAPASLRLLETLADQTSIVTPVTLTAGKATVVVADSGLSTAGFTTATFEIQSNVSGSWATLNDSTTYNWGGSTTGHLTAVQVNWVAATAVDTIGLNADEASTPNTATAADLTVATNLTALAAADLRNAAANAPYYLSTGKAVVSGLVKNSVTAVAQPGASLTATAAGVLFNVGDVWSVGSISFIANASGQFAINAYSNVSGATKIVVKSATGTATATVTYAGVAASTATKIAAAAASTTVQAGRAVDYTATVTDKLGNVVAGFVLKATVAGAGSFAGTTAADGSVSVTTDAKGKAIVKVLYSSADQGTATVTFADPTVDTTIVAVAVATEVGSTDSSIDIVNNRVTAVASFSKGKTVSFYVDGLKKWSKTSASDADVVLNYNLKKGTHTVTVKISGGFVTTEKFIVK